MRKALIALIIHHEIWMWRIIITITIIATTTKIINVKGRNMIKSSIKLNTIAFTHWKIIKSIINIAKDEVIWIRAMSTEETYLSNKYKHKYCHNNSYWYFVKQYVVNFCSVHNTTQTIIESTINSQLKC